MWYLFLVVWYCHSFVARQQNETIMEKGPLYVYHPLLFGYFLLLFLCYLVRILKKKNNENKSQLTTVFKEVEKLRKLIKSLVGVSGVCAVTVIRLLWNQEFLAAIFKNTQCLFHLYLKTWSGHFHKFCDDLKHIAIMCNNISDDCWNSFPCYLFCCTISDKRLDVTDKKSYDWNISTRFVKNSLVEKAKRLRTHILP